MKDGGYSRGTELRGENRMRNEKTTLPKNTPLLLISVLLFVLNCLPAAGAAASADKPICGSVERFSQSHRWQDLPGCTQERGYSNPTSAVTLLGRAKDAFKSFFETWERGDVDHVDSNSGGCLVFMNGADDEWNSNPELVRAKPAYEEMKGKVEQYLDWLPLVRDLESWLLQLPGRPPGERPAHHERLRQRHAFIRLPLNHPAETSKRRKRDHAKQICKFNRISFVARGISFARECG